MNDKISKRIIKEIEKIKSGEFNDVDITIPNEKNIKHLNAIVYGPKDTYYYGGKFIIDIILSKDYPLKPPKIKFITKIFHPNIGLNGTICLDILQHKWSPAMSIANVITSIQLLLQEPNPDSPLNSKAASLYKNNINEYSNIVNSWINQYC
jgi:ubiquitin-protein ligase